MLVANGVRAGAGPQRFLFGAGALNVERARWAQRGARYNLAAGEATVFAGVNNGANRAAFPNGYLRPGAWQLPVKPGGMGATGGTLSGTATVTLGMAGGLNAQATLAGTCTLTADMGLIVSLVAAIAGTGSLTANGAAVAQLEADLAGTSSVTALLGAIVSLQATLPGTSTFTAAQTALGFMEATIEACSGLTVGQIVAAVWEALAVDYNDPGTMGGLLNDAGAGGNPWATVLEDNGMDTLTVLEGMRLILSATAGELSGAETTTVTIRDALDHIDRIIATVDASGNRTAVVIDVSD